ncbi:DUF6476 family protein [Arenibacterium sp. CAU 1754]
MTDPYEPIEEPANLRFLRRLVTVLTSVMILGLLVVVTLLVMRFSSSAPVVPDSITLPDGEKADAFTMTERWYGVVVNNGRRILIFDRRTGKQIQDIVVTSP